MRVFVYTELEQLHRGCEWNEVLVATAGEEVITLNAGHLGDAQGLIISLNASGFPMFSPYTHCWPMTHQPLYPHSKPLLHYLNREASCWEVGGQTPGSSSFIISPSSYKWRIHDLDHVHLAKCCTHFAFFQHVQKEPVDFYLDSADWLWCWRPCVTEHRAVEGLTSLHWESQWSDFCQRAGMSLLNNVSSVVWLDVNVNSLLSSS